MRGLARESQFYGAMDGAMKFVKGDAIASIVITLINIVGGLIIGVAMNDMTVMDAVQTYSILTIGNGLVSQIPALLISISAGMVVTRVASEDKDSNLGKDVAGQILGQPKAIAVASGLLTILALIPGLPKVPFFILAGVTGSLSYGLYKAQSIKVAAAEQVQQLAAKSGEDPQISLTLPLVLQASEALTPYVNVDTEEGKKFYDRLIAIRNGLYFELGVIFPPIQIKGNMPGEPGSYTIWANEVPIVNGQVRLDAFWLAIRRKTSLSTVLRERPPPIPLLESPRPGSRAIRLSAPAASATRFGTHPTSCYFISRTICEKMPRNSSDCKRCSVWSPL